MGASSANGGTVLGDSVIEGGGLWGLTTGLLEGNHSMYNLVHLFEYTSSGNCRGFSGC